MYAENSLYSSNKHVNSCRFDNTYVWSIPVDIGLRTIQL